MTLKSVSSYDTARPQGEWLNLSSAFTWLTALLGERQDLTVAVAEGAGWGAPAAYMFPIATVEMDSAYWPENFNVAKATPDDVRDWINYPAFLGMLCHEVAHANHSGWLYALGKRVENGTTKLSDDEKHGMGSAILLEEIRIEHQHLMHRSQDVPWLTSFATTISTAEAFKAKELTGIARASRCALLILGRIDGGDMENNAETKRVRRLIDASLGNELLGKLENIWRRFLKCQDDDDATMLALGTEWYKLTQDDPNDPQSGGTEMGQELSDLLDKLAETVAKEIGNDAGLKKMLERMADAIRASDKEMADRAQARAAARAVFGELGGAPQNQHNAFTGWQPPNGDERSLARRTAQKILDAYMREKTLMPHMAVLPPGRLNARAAMNRQAQRSMGMYPTAAPFKTVTRKANPSPPLDVGIVVDTSFSQSAAVKASSSAAYSLGQAVKIIPDGRVSLVTFGDKAAKVLGPYDRLQGVPCLNEGGGTGFLKQAVRAVDGEMNFLRKGAARLLVIVTDGMLNGNEFQGRDEMLQRLLKNGAHILWVHTARPGRDASPVGPNTEFHDHWTIPVLKHPNYRVAHMTSTAELPQLICDEAVKVLEVS